MYAKRNPRSEYESKIIDAHAHVGIHATMYEQLAYPCCQSIEGVYYRQLSGGVDVNVVFPFGSCDAGAFPYDIDNRRLMKEVYEVCPERSGRFMPFICMDTANHVARQIDAGQRLATKYPLYGIKINPVDRKVPVRSLESEGSDIIDFAKELDIPMLFHAVPDGVDDYSSAEDILDIAHRNPELRMCLAHGLLFCEDLLNHAASLANVWVDTAAIKIQVDLVRDLVRRGKLDKGRLINADYCDYRDVMKQLVTAYPNLIIWGSDSPCYSFMTRRQQAEGEYYDFCLTGRYEEEIAALRALTAENINTISNRNTLDLLFGRL